MICSSSTFSGEDLVYRQSKIHEKVDDVSCCLNRDYNYMTTAIDMGKIGTDGDVSLGKTTDDFICASSFIS